MPELLFPDDSLPSTAAESWVRHKVETIAQYLSSFASQLAGKVDDIIFVDLYAGNGLYSIGARKELFASAALKSLSLEVPISKFIFCEKDGDRLGTLKIRVNKYFRNRHIILLDGKPEDIVSRLDLYVPPTRGNYKSAVICLCDPFSLEMPFDCIRALAEKNFSFLIPFTFALNDRVNYEFYLVDNRERLKKFMGADNLDRIEKDVDSNWVFYKKLVQIYQGNLLSMGFNAATSVHKIDSGLMELPVYYTGFYSRNVSAQDIQEDVESTHNVQFDLFNS
ncbi:MAG TPA: three-Cys-motif partner protein TcmP [Cyclobacteriaceae bacterium]|nr:three-Cys-motif partner protein TcmP [Cyclobacteriaceae bacterium]